MNIVDSFDVRQSDLDVILRCRSNLLSTYKCIVYVVLVNTISVTRMKELEKNSITNARVRLEYFSQVNIHEDRQLIRLMSQLLTMRQPRT